MSLTKTSKFISLILRHKPEVIGIELDRHGWAKVSDLIRGVRTKMPLTMSMLEEIVATDEKQRYSFNEDKTKIRANQGHSIPVDLEFEEVIPPEILYHGTAVCFLDSIMKQGLSPQKRQFVHLSFDEDTAWKVGSRHGKPVVMVIDAAGMHRDGYVFYRSVNGVWLTSSVPVRYMTPVYQTIET